MSIGYRRRKPSSLLRTLPYLPFVLLPGIAMIGCTGIPEGSTLPDVVARADSATTAINTAIRINVLENDDHGGLSQIESYNQAVDEENNEQPNSVMDDYFGILVYSPPTDFVGTARFNYRIEGDDINYASESWDRATVTVEVKEILTLTVTKAGDGDGTVTSEPAGIDCGADCQEDYLPNAAVSMTAVPDSTSQFDGWSGDEDCTDGYVTMNTDVNCTATFDQAGGELSQLTFQVTGDGTVGSSDGGIDCEPDCSESYVTGTIAQIYATLVGPDVESVTWGGDCAEFGQETGFNLTMDSDKNCTATFE